MQAITLISSTVRSISPEEFGNMALEMMDQFRVNHLAVVRKNVYLGVVSDKEIMNWESEKDSIEKHLNNLAAPYVLYNQHLFDIIEVLEKNNLSAVPVLNKENKYLGMVKASKLLYSIAKSAAIQSPGGVIVLEINVEDYSLTEISSIIESNNTKILSSYIISKPKSRKIEVTLKLNKQNTTAIIKDFERREYNVSASYKNEESNYDVLERYESFMRFMNT